LKNNALCEFARFWNLLSCNKFASLQNFKPACEKVVTLVELLNHPLLRIFREGWVVLRGFLAVARVAQHPGDHAEHSGPGVVVEGRERVHITPCHLAQQCVEFGGHRGDPLSGPIIER
jgi:hypothetical protein